MVIYYFSSTKELDFSDNFGPLHNLCYKDLNCTDFPCSLLMRGYKMFRANLKLNRLEENLHIFMFVR